MLENKEAFNKAFGKRLRETRKRAGKRAEAVAEAAGISPQFLSDVERGKKGVSNYNLANLALALHVTTDYLLFGRKGADAAWEQVAERLTGATPATLEMAGDILLLALDLVQENVPE